MFEIAKIFLVIYQTLIIFRQPFRRHACHLFIILHKANKKPRKQFRISNVFEILPKTLGDKESVYAGITGRT